MSKKNITWWKKESIYQIYPLSFYDANGDGYGDILGIISKLDYIAELGFGGIWLCPIFNSPMKDNGYDVSNFYEINPLLGKMEDFEKLVEECKKKSIRIIMDIPLNHASTKSDWFIESENNPKGKYGEYFVWRDKPVKGFFSPFELEAWTFSEKRKQYYLHQFAKDQPDLNWENPVILEEFINIINFWIAKGIEGIRFDVLDMIGKNIDLGKNIVTKEVHKKILKMREKTWKNNNNFMTVGECWSAGRGDALKYTSKEQKELSMIFAGSHNFIDEKEGKWFRKEINLVKYKKSIFLWQEALKTNGWNAIFLENHDFSRSISRFLNDNKYWEESAKALALILFGLRGTSFVYQGQEIGTINSKYEKIEEINDVETKNWFNKLVNIEKKYTKTDFFKVANLACRDNGRKPMQWDSNAKYNGFSKSNPWIKIYKKEPREFVNNQTKDEGSVLNWYKKLISLKKNSEILQKGVLEPIWIDDPKTFSFVRKFKNEELYFLINWTSDNLELENILEKDLILSSNFNDGILGPYGSLISKIKINKKGANNG